MDRIAIERAITTTHIVVAAIDAGINEIEGDKTHVSPLYDLRASAMHTLAQLRKERSQQFPYKVRQSETRWDPNP